MKAQSHSLSWPEEIVELFRFETGETACPYLPEETALFEQRIVGDVSPEAFGELLRRGWRRFGRIMNRPACPRCSKCVSLRIRIPEFELSRSQRRAQIANEDIEVLIQRPSVTDEHVRLFNRYHEFMQTRRGWPARPITEENYHMSFLDGNWSFAREFLYLRKGTLVGVALVDVVPNAVSSVYFFHDPEWREQSPGVFSILTTATFARERGLKYQYLGSWLAECSSLSYKANYKPHERLAFLPADDEEPIWISTDEISHKR